MSKRWKEFWRDYRKGEVHSEEDLFVQVGKTVAQHPIGHALLERMLDEIAKKLDLQPTDRVLDMCCGNGIITFALADRVDSVIAIDFAEHLISTATRFKSKPNIRYLVEDVEQALASGRYPVADKYLMNDALAYFSPEGLERILESIIAASAPGNSKFTILLTGIPDYDRKWSFYDTDERRQRHLNNEALETDINDGMGRWWLASEIITICNSMNLSVSVQPQHEEISVYRMDALIQSKL